MLCPICKAKKTRLFREIDGIEYFECSICGSLFADAGYLSRLSSETAENYSDQYWKEELSAARERSFGSSISRVAEVFLYARIPVTRFLDIGSGPGYLLDSLSILMPDFRDRFHGVELFPPPEQYRTEHENYITGSLIDVDGKFSAGTCIEVIEHLTPDVLDSLIHNLARVSEPGAIYYFNSAQPEFVKNEDPDYLDPYNRGHIVSYSIKALNGLFGQSGFKVIPLPGRTWGFLAEFDTSGDVPDAEQLLHRVWTALPENVSMLKSNGFGPLMYSIGIESARCYAESAIANDRTSWALSLLKK